MKGIYASILAENSDNLPDNSIRFIYREFLLDQFIKNVISLPEQEIYLNWWKLIPWKNKDKILFEGLKDKYKFNYSFDDVKYLYEQFMPKFDNETMSILNWWFELNDDKKNHLIHNCINPHFHITAPDIDEIKMLFGKQWFNQIL